MEMIVDIRKVKRCAFCRNWYDPTNSVIAPMSPQMGIWKILDTNKRCMCLKKKLLMPAHASCTRDYICKL